MKATHEGTCQLCGRQQRLPGGKLAKHGYTVEWGFFSGVCPGSHEQPYETSRALIAERIYWATSQITDLINQAENLGRDLIWVLEKTESSFKRGMRNGSREWRALPRSEISITQSYVTFAKWVGRDGKPRKTSINDPVVYGPVDEIRAVTLLQVAYANHLRSMAKKVEQYRDWLQARFDSWVFAPEKLVAVKDDAKQPIMHWRGGRWSHGKACAASAMGARKGRATSNTAAVNCPKCIAIIERNKEKP